MFLHAASVSFVWPESGDAFRIEAPLPDDLASLFQRLRESPGAHA
jgi:hypothetical protein